MKSFEQSIEGLASLTKREKDVLRKRFGVDEVESDTSNPKTDGPPSSDDSNGGEGGAPAPATTPD